MKKIADFFKEPLTLAFYVTALFFLSITLISYQSIFSVFSIRLAYLALLLYFFIFVFLCKQAAKILKISVFLAFVLLLFFIASIRTFSIRQSLGLGQIYQGAGKYRLASQEIKRAIRYPGHLDKGALCLARFNLIWLYLNIRDWENAAQEGHRLWLLDQDAKIIKIDQDPRGAYYYALYYDKRGSLEEAKQRYLNVINQYPDNDTLYYRLAQIYATNQDFDKAAYYCELAIKLAPGRADYHFLRGTLYARKLEYPAGLIEYRKALDLDPGNRQFALDTCTLYSNHLPKDKEAEKFARQLIKRYPAEAGPHRLLALVYRENLEYKYALREYRRAIRLDPKNAALFKEFLEFKNTCKPAGQHSRDKCLLLKN